MIPRLFGSKASLLSLGAILTFFVFMLFSGYRLIQIERSLDYYVGEEMPWTIGQAQFEAVRFMNTVSRFVEGDEAISQDEVQLRYDIFSSRLRLMTEGELRRYLEKLGTWTEMERDITTFTALQPQIRHLSFGDKATESRIRETVEPLSVFLRDLTNKSMLEERFRDGAIRDMRRKTMLEILSCMIGILVGGVVLSALIIRSHREIARTEASLRRERELSRAYRSLISTVSHQFRTPLAVIDSTAQRMIRRGNSLTWEEVALRTARIRDTIARLLRLMESTLNAARLDEGEISYRPRETDLAHLVVNLCERQQEMEQSRRVLVDVAALPPRILCDPMLTEQALSNLVSNALKYSDRSQSVSVKAWMQRNIVFLSVQDHGVGIPADELPHIFDQFFRARTAQGVAGTGIGLSFARQAIRLQGGDIDIKSQEGQGSTFTIRLPVQIPDMIAPAAAA